MKTAPLCFVCALLLFLADAARGQSCALAGGTLGFGARSSELSAEAKAALTLLAEELSSHAGCRVIISGTGGGSKWSEERSWDRINTVINYMAQEHRISRERFISRYIGTAAKDQLSYRAAREGEAGSSLETDPYPGLLKK